MNVSNLVYRQKRAVSYCVPASPHDKAELRDER